MTVSVEEQAPQDEALPPEAPAKPKLKAVDEYASFDDLLNKPARERDVSINVSGKELKIHLRAIGAVEYDQLMASCPATGADRDAGMLFDRKTFAPKLIAACVTRPRMTYDQASRLYADPNWAGGEAGGLFTACVEICQTGLNVPFSGSG